jgi:hypothetical protein
VWGGAFLAVDAADLAQFVFERGEFGAAGHVVGEFDDLHPPPRRPAVPPDLARSRRTSGQYHDLVPLGVRRPLQRGSRPARSLLPARTSSAESPHVLSAGWTEPSAELNLFNQWEAVLLPVVGFASSR